MADTERLFHTMDDACYVDVVYMWRVDVFV